MATERGRIFVSYSHADADLVRPMCEALKTRGYALWLDQDRLVLGDRLAEEIDRALEDSIAFIAFVGPHYFLDGKFTRKEFYAAWWLARLIPSWRLLIVRLDEHARIPPMSLDSWRIDYAGLEETVRRIARLLERLGEVDGVRYSSMEGKIESDWSTIDVDELNDRDLRLVARAFMDQRIQRLRTAGVEIHFRVELGLERTVRFSVLRAIVSDTATHNELAHELRQIEVSEHYIAEAKALLTEGLLGRFKVGYERLCKEHEGKTERAHANLRRHLKEMAERLELRTERRDEGGARGMVE